MNERYEKTGEKDYLEKVHTIKKGIDKYKEEIRDKKLHKAMFMMQFNNVELNAEHIELFFIDDRKNL
ncbi:hypothetical protein [Flavobacterium sp. DSP2-3-1]|uniref:hypothetical protein n=1 Tax=unclassified Flavobacterium TaxID=196869 RepID=UPI003CF5788E